MVTKSKDGDAVAREAAEKSMPGWTVVTDSDEATPDADVKVDFTGKDIAALKEKYLGALTDAPARFPNEDAKFVKVRSKKKGDAPVKLRKIVMAGKEVVGFQG